MTSPTIGTGPLGTGLDDPPTKRVSRKGRGNQQRKTVTFGDASAVTGNFFVGVITVVVLIVIWYLLTKVWGISQAFRDMGVAEGWNEIELLNQCEDAADCSYTQILNRRTMPAPWDVVTAFGDLWSEGFRNVSLWDHTWFSLKRVFMGLSLGVLLGVPVGLAMGLSNTLRGMFDPVVELLRPVPPLAFIALIIVWFGIFEKSKVAILFFAAFWIMIIASRAGVQGVQLSKVHAAYSLGASKMQILMRVILPNALPEIITGLRVSLGVCWGTLVAAEIVAATEGLGAMTWTASKFLRMDVVVVGIIIVGVLGFTMDVLMRKIEARLIPWRGKG